MVCSPRKLLAHANKREGVVFTVALNVSRNTKNLQNWKTDFNFLSTIFLSENLEYKFQLDSVPLKIFCSLSPTVQSHNYFCVHSADKVNSDTQISKTSELFFSMYLPLTQITLQLTFAFFFFLNHQFLKPVKNEQAISLLSLFLCCISFLARSTYNMQDALLNVLLVKINIHGAGTNFSCIRNHAFTVPTLQS